MAAKYTLFQRKGDDRSSPIWYALIRQDGRRRAYSTGCTDREDAEEYVRKHLGVDGLAPTLRVFVERRHLFEPGACRWLARRQAGGHTITPNTLKVYRAALDRIVAAFGDKRLHEITLDDLEAWVLNLPVASSSKSIVMGILRLVFKEAIRAGFLPLEDNPTAMLEPVKVSNLKRAAFSLAELAQMFPPDRQKAIEIWGSEVRMVFFLLLATTGARNAEGRALQWKHYLANDRALLIEQQVQGNELVPTKGKRDRLVLLPDRTVAELENWHVATPYAEASDFMFPTAEGKPYGSRCPAAWLRAALPRAEIQTGNRVLVVHSFRHAYVTNIRRSVPADALGEMVGHRSEAVTAGYDHPTIAQRLSALGPARAGISGLIPAGDEHAKG